MWLLVAWGGISALGESGRGGQTHLSKSEHIADRSEGAGGVLCLRNIGEVTATSPALSRTKDLRGPTTTTTTTHPPRTPCRLAVLSFSLAMVDGHLPHSLCQQPTSKEMVRRPCPTPRAEKGRTPFAHGRARERERTPPPPSRIRERGDQPHACKTRRGHHSHSFLCGRGVGPGPPDV